MKYGFLFLHKKSLHLQFVVVNNGRFFLSKVAYKKKDILNSKCPFITKVNWLTAFMKSIHYCLTIFLVLVLLPLLTFTKYIPLGSISRFSILLFKLAPFSMITPLIP